MPRPLMPLGSLLIRCSTRPLVWAMPTSVYIGLEGTTARTPCFVATAASEAAGT